MYKRVSSRTVVSHPRLTLVEDTIVLPNGQHAPYLRQEGRADAVGIIAIDAEGRILVEREYSYVPDVWLYQFPGGGMDHGETQEQAANRELREEVGLAAATLTPIGSVYLQHRLSPARIHLFVGTGLTEQPAETNDPYECGIEVHWMTEDEIRNLIARGEVTNAPMLAAWALYTCRSATPTAPN
jgi:8-oxo-dGTP pyrophosphatase MutT (NUDIX family)